MHYDSFPEFKGGLKEVPSFPATVSDAKIDILFQYYNLARGQAQLTLGRLADTQKERESRGSVFEGGKGQLLLTLRAQGFSTKKPAANEFAGASAVGRGVLQQEWKDGKMQVASRSDWEKKSTQQQMETMLGNMWSIWLNDAYILGGIHGHVEFDLVSKVDFKPNPAGDFPFNVTQRELFGLLMFGYSSGQPPKPTTYRCTNPQLADSATFKTYVAQMEKREAEARATTAP